MQHPRRHMKKLTTAFGAPVDDNQNIATAGERGPALLQDAWFLEKMAHFDREVIPERRMHAKGAGAFGTFTATHDITSYTKARIFSEIGKVTPMFARFSTVAGERGAADAERDIRGFALKFYTEEGNWDLVGNNTPVFFIRDPLKFPDLNHAIKRDPRTGMRSPDNNWDYWTLLPEALHQVTIVMSDRGIPRSFRRMHGFGRRPDSFLNTRYVACSPALDPVHPGDAGERCQYVSIEPFRSDQGVAAQGLPANRSRRHGAESQPGQFLRGCRTGRVQSGQYCPRDRFLARQDVAGTFIFLRRYTTLSARRQLFADPGECTEMSVP